MAMSNKKKAVIAGGVALLALLGFSGAANADDLLPDDDLPPPPPDDDDVIIVDPPLLCPPGQVNVGGVCVTPPPPPPANVCNYLGCGQVFDAPKAAQGITPITTGVFLQQLGYPLNPAANGFSLISGYSMAVVREFQRDYNAVRSSNGLAGPAAAAGATAQQRLQAIKAASSLDTDGLVGNMTLAAINRARSLRDAIGLSWEAIVNLSV
jgi:hypothetical protein